MIKYIYKKMNIFDKHDKEYQEELKKQRELKRKQWEKDYYKKNKERIAEYKKKNKEWIKIQQHEYYLKTRHKLTDKYKKQIFLKNYETRICYSNDS